MKRNTVLVVLLVVLFSAITFSGEKQASATDSTTVPVYREQVINDWKKQAQELDERFYRTLTPEQRSILDTQKQLFTQINLFKQLADSTVRVKK